MGMDMGQKVQVLEGVLAAVINRALNTDKLPVPVVRLALADAVHAVRELERQQTERLEAEKKRQNDEAARKAAMAQKSAAVEELATIETLEAAAKERM